MEILTNKCCLFSSITTKFHFTCLIFFPPPLPLDDVYRRHFTGYVFLSPKYFILSTFIVFRSHVHTYTHAHCMTKESAHAHVKAHTCVCALARVSCIILYVFLCKWRPVTDNRCLCLILEEFEVTANLQTWGHRVWGWTPDLQRCWTAIVKTADLVTDILNLIFVSFILFMSVCVLLPVSTAFTMCQNLFLSIC